MEYPEQIYEGYYCSLFEDGTMSFNDGVGYVGEGDKEETRELYEALREYFENE